MRKLICVSCTTVLLAGCSGLSLTQDQFQAVSQGSLEGYRSASPYERGKAQLQAGNFGLAITEFNQELARNPNSVPALNGLGIAYSKLHRDDVANDYWQRALSLDPNSEITLNNLAYLNLQRGDREMALAYANQASTQASSAPATAPGITSVIAANFAAASGRPTETTEILAEPEELAAVEEPDLQEPRSLERVGEREWQLNTLARADDRQEVVLSLNNPPPPTVTVQSLMNDSTVVLQPLPSYATSVVPSQAASEQMSPSVQQAKTLQELIDDPTVMVQRLPGLEEFTRSSSELISDGTDALHSAVVDPVLETPEETRVDLAITSPIIWNDIDLRVSNGIGRENMASRFAEFIAEQGIAADLVTNASTFDYQASYIFYNPGLEAAANQIAAMMPVPVRLVEATQGTGTIEIILGADLLAFDQGLQEI